jgi:ElaB/YqjD/DUF883 family membrane-anchored ribosome-binding protein
MSTSTTSRSRRVSASNHNSNHSSDHLKNIVREAKVAVSEAGDQASDKIVALRSQLKAGVAGIKSRAKNVTKAVRQQAAKADKKIRANPYKSIGIAAGAGLVAGYLVSRRRAKSS